MIYKEYFRNIFEDLWLYHTQLLLSECAKFLTYKNKKK